MTFSKEATLSHRYEELDALRGIAALMVALFHFTMGRDDAQVGFQLGTTGVDLFFIISGFVISMSIAKVSTASEFVINRASRLYPTYWASVSLTFLIITVYGQYKGAPIRWVDYLGNLTMFQYYLKIPNLDNPYWTMTVELVFYFFMVILFHFRILHKLDQIGITITIFVVLIASFFWEMIGESLFRIIPLLEFFPLFFAGMIFYKIMNDKHRLPRYYVVLTGLLIAQISLFWHAGLSRNFISQAAYAAMLTIFFLLFILFVNHRLRFIVNKPLLFLGKISFALYLTHEYIIIGHVLPYLVNRLEINFWISSLFIALPISLAIASCITFFIDVPGNAIMRRTLTRALKRMN